MTLASCLSDASVLTDKTKLVLAQEQTKTKKNLVEKNVKTFLQERKELTLTNTEEH